MDLNYGRETSRQATLKRLTFPLAIVGAAILCLITCLGSLFLSMNPDVGHSVTTRGCPVRGLPRDAQDIRFFIAGSFGPATSYDFRISEASFVQWAKQNGWEVTPNSPLQIPRLNPATERIEYVDITEGLLHEHQFDLDSFRRVAFDRANQRAYYWYNSR